MGLLFVFFALKITFLGKAFQAASRWRQIFQTGFSYHHLCQCDLFYRRRKIAIDSYATKQLFILSVLLSLYPLRSHTRIKYRKYKNVDFFSFALLHQKLKIEVARKRINLVQKVQFCLSVQRGDLIFGLLTLNFRFSVCLIMNAKKGSHSNHNRRKFVFLLQLSSPFLFDDIIQKMSSSSRSQCSVGFYPKLFDNSGTTLKIRVGTTI